MSKLEYMARPLVAFNPSNKHHRQYYAEFLEYGGWGRCPVRFIVTDDHGIDLTSMIKNMLTQYYIDREFGGGALAKARSFDLKKTADEMYREAGKLRKEATNLLKPRRT